MGRFMCSAHGIQTSSSSAGSVGFDLSLARTCHSPQAKREVRELPPSSALPVSQTASALSRTSVTMFCCIGCFSRCRFACPLYASPFRLLCIDACVSWELHK